MCIDPDTQCEINRLINEKALAAKQREPSRNDEPVESVVERFTEHEGFHLYFGDGI